MPMMMGIAESMTVPAELETPNLAAVIQWIAPYTTPNIVSASAAMSSIDVAEKFLKK